MTNTCYEGKQQSYSYWGYYPALRLTTSFNSLFLFVWCFLSSFVFFRGFQCLVLHLLCFCIGLSVCRSCKEEIFSSINSLQYVSIACVGSRCLYIWELRWFTHHPSGNMWLLFLERTAFLLSKWFFKYVFLFFSSSSSGLRWNIHRDIRSPHMC